MTSGLWGQPRRSAPPKAGSTLPLCPRSPWSWPWFGGVEEFIPAGFWSSKAGGKPAFRGHGRHGQMKKRGKNSKHQTPSTNEAPNSMVQHPRETEEGRRRLKRICLVLTFHSGRGLAPETGALQGVGLGSEGEIVLGGLHGRTVMGRVRPSRSGVEGFLEANPTINHGAIVGHPSRIKTRKKAGIFEQEVTEETEGEDGPKAKSPSQKDVCPIAAGWSGPSGPIHAPLHAPHR